MHSASQEQHVDESSWCEVDRCQITPSCWLQILGANGCSEEVYQNIGILFPGTIPKSEEVSGDPRFRNYELALRQDIDSGKSRWSDNIFMDFLIYLVNTVPVFAIFFTHPLSSLLWDFRIIVAILDFIMFASVFIFNRHLNYRSAGDVEKEGAWRPVHHVMFAAMIIFTMLQKTFLRKLSKCSCGQRVFVYTYFFIVMVPLLFLLCEYIFGDRFNWSGRGNAVVFAFLWSTYTSCGKTIVYFTINSVRCLKNIYRTILCGCCSEEKKNNVTWKHFQVWQELGRPNMLDFQKQKLKEIQNRASTKLGKTPGSVEELGKDWQTSSFEMKLAQESRIKI